MRDHFCCTLNFVHSISIHKYISLFKLLFLFSYEILISICVVITLNEHNKPIMTLTNYSNERIIFIFSYLSNFSTIIFYIRLDLDNAIYFIFAHFHKMSCFSKSKIYCNKIRILLFIVRIDFDED